MTALMKLILSLSLSGSLLILLLLLFRPLYRNRLSKSWQYYIWIVVILRLLLPVTPETSLAGSLFSLEEMRGTDSTAAPESPNDQSMTAYNTIKHEAGSSDDLIRDATTAENSPSASAVSPDKEAYNEDHSQIFFFLWLTGALSVGELRSYHGTEPDKRRCRSVRQQPRLLASADRLFASAHHFTAYFFVGKRLLLYGSA